MACPFYIEDYPDLVVDVRGKIPGNSFDNCFPFFYVDLKNYVGCVIHHTAGSPDQSIDDIAWYHITARKWGGIGYHFVIDKEGIVYYVGDLGTARAHVAGLNEKYIGICLIGNFMGSSNPTKIQLENAHLLCEEFIKVEKVRFPNVNDWNDIIPHRNLSATLCPGDTHPNWWQYIINGFAKDWKTKAEEFEKKYESYAEKYKVSQKKLSEATTAIEKAKEICEGFERRVQDLVLELVPVNKLKVIIEGLESEIVRLKATKYTVSESLRFLINSLKGGVK